MTKGQIAFGVTMPDEGERAAYEYPDRPVAAVVVEGALEIRIGQSSQGLVLQVTVPIPPCVALAKPSALSLDPAGPGRELAKRIRGAKVRMIIDAIALVPEVRAQLAQLEEQRVAAMRDLVDFGGLVDAPAEPEHQVDPFSPVAEDT
jgi:hypothetical protein